MVISRANGTWIWSTAGLRWISDKERVKHFLLFLFQCISSYGYLWRWLSQTNILHIKLNSLVMNSRGLHMSHCVHVAGVHMCSHFHMNIHFKRQHGTRLHVLLCLHRIQYVNCCTYTDHVYLVHISPMQMLGNHGMSPASPLRTFLPSDKHCPWEEKDLELGGQSSQLWNCRNILEFHNKSTEVASFKLPPWQWSWRGPWGSHCQPNQYHRTIVRITEKSHLKDGIKIWSINKRSSGTWEKLCLSEQLLSEIAAT